MFVLTLGLLKLSILLAQSVFVLVVCPALYRCALGPLRKLPGPWHTKFTNLVLKYKILKGQRIFYIHELHQKYGPVVRIEPHEVNVCDLDAFSEIHRIGNGFVKAAWYDRATFGIDHNVFVMTNVREHAARRKLLARPFSRSSLLLHFEALVHGCAQTAVAKIKQETAAQDCDVYKWWTLMATDVIHSVAFGEPPHLLEAGQKTSYIDDLESVIWLWALRGEAPALYHMMRLVAPGQFKRFNESLYNVVSYGTSAATGAERTNLGKYNIITGMIEDSRMDGAALTDTAVGAQASALIVAGSGTTAVTLTYGIWAILSHQEVRERLQHEVIKLPANYDDVALEKLPYLRAVITEVLRLYGAAPGSLPRIVPARGMSIHGEHLPAGCTVTTQSYTMHRDPAVFPEPERFDPDRFYLQEMTTAQKKAFAPFGGGTRVCLGVHLAEMELRHALAEFFRECHDLQLSPQTTAETMEMENYFLIAPKSGRCLLRAGSSDA